MNLTRKAITLCVAAVSASCATYEPVSKEYTGPTAVLRDSGFSEDGSKAQMFAAIDIDGNRIMNAFWASRNASQGRGNSLTTIYPERKVKALPMKVSLVCSHATGAPIAEIASRMAGTFFAVEGVVDFTPKADGKYVVRGELKKEKSTCWIQDVDSGQAATAIVSK